MAMTDQTVRGRTRRSVATVVQAKIVIIFLGTRARKLGTAIIQAGERASLGGTGINRAKVTRKPRATGRGSIVGGLAGINVAGGIRGVGSTCVVRRYRRSPTRLRRGGCTARKDIPSCTAGLFAFCDCSYRAVNIAVSPGDTRLPEPPCPAPPGVPALPAPFGRGGTAGRPLSLPLK